MIEKFNLGSIMKGAKKLQEMIEKNQAELAKTEVTGESGAGLVQVKMNGLFSVTHLSLADELLSQPKAVIEELITAAFNNATQKASRLTQSKMSDMSQLFSGLGDSDKPE